MKQPVVQAFAARVKAGNIGHGVQVTYRVAGGMPSQRVEFEVALDSVSGAKVKAYDARTSRIAKESSIPPHSLDVGGLFEQISDGLHSLLPASRATFLPDALVGSITISIDNNEETFYFIPEEEKRGKLGKSLAPSMDRALQRFWNIAKSASAAQDELKR